MKVTKPEKMWWVGKQDICANCETKIEFEDGDTMSPYFLSSMYDNDAGWFCPGCGRQNRMYKAKES